MAMKPCKECERLETRVALAMLPCLLTVLAFSLSGCSTAGTSVMLGGEGPHPSTDPEKVVLLIAPPQQPYKPIAMVEGVAATDDYFTEARTKDAALRALKKEAARIGADAVILGGQPTATPYGSVTVGSTTGAANAVGVATPGGAVGMGTATGTVVATQLGWEKWRFSGIAIRYER